MLQTGGVMKNKKFGQTNNTTSELFHMIQEKPDQFASDYIGNKEIYGAPVTLQQYLQDLLQEHEMSIPDLIVKTILSKSFVYQVFSGKRNPGRDILLRMAFAMHLSIEETQRLFIIAGKGALYPKVHRDAIIMFCLEKGMSLDEANEFLENSSERGIL